MLGVDEELVRVRVSVRVRARVRVRVRVRARVGVRVRVRVGVRGRVEHEGSLACEPPESGAPVLAMDSVPI